MENILSNRWCIVINPSSGHDLNDISIIVSHKLNEIYGYKYATIVHDNDYDDLGKLKTEHLHVVIWKGSRVRKSTLLNRISEFICQDLNTISIDVCISLKQSIRYLIHLDTPEKHQYLKTEVDSNAFDEVSNFFEDIDNDITGATLYQLMKECDFDKSSIAIQLGPTKYCRWRAFIELFCK